MNKIEQYLKRHWYHDQKPFLTFFLLPLSYIFSAIISVRKTYYRMKHVLFSSSKQLPVIVIGNITVGGSGKTPVVIETVQYLKSIGLKPAVLSRGYKCKSNATQLVTEEGSVEMVGDEPLLIFKKTQVPVITGKNRKRSLKFLQRVHPECNVVVSDDGLQHYNLQRDLEVVLYDPDLRFGNEALLPMGPLREPLSRLKQADFILPKQIQITQFRNSLSGELVSSQHFRNKSCVAIAGIANPDSFFNSLKGFDIEFEPIPLSDHGYMNMHSLQKFADKLIIMTEKDAIKYPPQENLWIAETVSEIPSDFYSQIKQVSEQISNI